MVNLVKLSTVHLRWMLLIRNIHFTWEVLVHLVTRGVSLVIYKCIESIHISCMVLQLYKELKITFNSITIQLANINFSHYLSIRQIMKYK